MPQHWGVLGRRRRSQRHSHHHAHGRHLHPGLPLLCSQNLPRTSATGSYGGQPRSFAELLCACFSRLLRSGMSRPACLMAHHEHKQARTLTLQGPGHLHTSVANAVQPAACKGVAASI